jgi:DNA helicase-2/ATP-dependent DNA helicase PcrA
MKKIKLKKQQKAGQNTSHSSKKRRLDYQSLLNTEQLQAVMHNNGPALVIAGAGTGKTRTVTYRVARLIEDGVPPESILLMTFTRKAANEMKDRSVKLLDGRAGAITAGTFHSFASMVLRRYGKELGYNANFSILDAKDAEDTIGYVRQRYMESKGIDAKSKRHPKAGFIQRIYSMAINKGESIQDLVFKENNRFLDLVPFIEDIIKGYGEYKKKASAMDYDDLLVNLRDILKLGGNAWKAISSRYRYIMVDEYQDTNRLQHEISMLLSGPKQNIMAVGDEAQSIYSFRGAEYSNILFFPQQFDDCKVYKIQTNYRSTDQILGLSNSVMKAAAMGYEKELIGVSSGDKPRVVSTATEKQQSLFIVQDILEMRENGEDLNEIAILIRNGYHSFDLELEFDKTDIRFQKYGGLRFSETAHIKDVLAYLKVAANPDDVIAWRRLLLLQPGIGSVTASKIIEGVQSGDMSFEKGFGQLSKGEELRKQIQAVLVYKTNPEAAVTKTIEIYTPILENAYKDFQKRLKDLEQFVTMVAGYKSLDSMLADISVDPPTSSVNELAGDDPEDEIVTISTIHSAKGLEWKHVYIIWALEGKFPSGRTGEDIDAIEEERRLFYVAATRAKCTLTITHPVNIFDRATGYVLSTPSRFLETVTEETAPRFVIEEDEEDDEWENDYLW